MAEQEKRGESSRARKASRYPPSGLWMHEHVLRHGPPKPEDDMIKLIRHAIDSRITFLDTSDVYGPHTNEILALKGGYREKVQASFKRLDIDQIDLYYQHRIDITVPIEVTMGELKKLVEEGKIKYVGLSKHVVPQLKGTCGSPHYCKQRIEWSPWTVDVEEDIIPTRKNSVIGIVPYSPLGRGFFSLGPKITENFSQTDFRKQVPRFHPENMDHNKHIFERVNEMATRKGCTPGQLSTCLGFIIKATTRAQYQCTTKVKNFNENREHHG
ncbi:hypothetical protein Dimus_032056 [Dionaea muscipula]